MGVIKRQGIKTMAVNIVGALIGALATLYVYTSNDDIYGYAQALIGLVSLLMPLASFGMLSLTIKYFPSFESSDKKGYNGLLSLILLGLVVAFALFSLTYLGFKEEFYSALESLNMNSEVFRGSELIILSLLGFMILTRFLTAQAANKLRIVIPNIITELGYKIYLPVLVLIYAFYKLSYQEFGAGLVFFFLAASLFLFLYLLRIDGFKLGKIKKPDSAFSFKDMMSYSAFGSLNQFGQNLAFRLDTVMIALFMTQENVSFYFKAFVFTSLIEMPTRALFQITSPIISQAWESKNFKLLDQVYKKTSLNLFAVGCFFFLGIWYSIGDLVNISADPTKFPFVETIFLLLGASKLIEMVTSVNNQIIIYSSFYKYNLYFLLILAIGNLVMNYFLIPSHGIKGAAIATAASILLYNAIKMTFIIAKFKLQPFTMGTIKTLVLFSMLFAVSYFWPFDFSPILNIIIKSIFVAVIYLPITYFWRISEDLNKFIDDALAFIIKRKWT